MSSRSCLGGLLSIALAVVVAGCAVSQVNSISVSPLVQTVGVGQTVQFAATGTYGSTGHLSSQDVTSQVTWKSSAPAVASISSTGLATALSVGTTTISASMSGYGGLLSASATLTVKASTSPNELIVSMAIVPATQTATAVGQQANFVAIATTGSGATVNLTNQGWTVPGTSPALTVAPAIWNSSSPGVATIDSATGIATAKGSGTTTITAIATNPVDGTVVTGTATLTVTIPASPEPLLSLAILPANQTSLTTGAGANVNFVAIGTLASGATVDLTTTPYTVNPGTANAQTISAANWTSSNGAVASIVANAAASATTPPGTATPLGAGTTAITARATNPDGTVVGATAAYTVTGSTSAEPYVSLAIVPAAQTLTALGQQARFIAIGTTGSGATVDLTSQATWNISSSTVATPLGGGNFQAAANGVAAVTAKVANPGIGGNPPDGTVVTASAALTVSISATPEPLVSLAVVPASQTALAVNQTANFIAIGTTASGTTVQLTGQQQIVNGATINPVTWSSSNLQVASICSGAAPFTAPCTANNGGLATALTAGATAITAIVRNPDGTVVTGTAAYTVTASTSAEPLVSLVVIPGTQTALAVNQTANFIAIGTTASGTTVQLTGLQQTVNGATINPVTWSSSNPQVASICSGAAPFAAPCTATNGGLATALTAGATAFTAIVRNPDGTVVTGSAAYTVTVPAATEPYVSLAIVPATQTLTAAGPASTPAQYLAMGTTASGATVNLTSQAIWDSSSHAVAKPTGVPGQFQAVANGATAIVAYFNNSTANGNAADLTIVQGTASLTVTIAATPEPLTSLAISPNAQSVAAVGQTTQFLAIGDFLSTSSTPGQQNMTTVPGYTVTWYSSNPAVAAICNGIASDPAACTVSGNKLPAGTAVATGVGTSAITAVAIATDNSGTTATATFTVAGPSAQTVTSLGIFPGSQTISLPLPNAAPLLPAQLPKFVAIGTYAATGLQVDLSNSPALEWISSNPLVATVNSGGYVQAIGVGTATITAEYLSGTNVVIATATVTVTAATVTEPYVSLAIVPGTQLLTAAGPASTPAQYLAMGTTPSGATVNLTSQAIWDSSNHAVAVPTGVPGQFQAKANGSTAITAYFNNSTANNNASDKTAVQGSASLTVAIAATPEALVSLAISPNAQSVVAVGQTTQFLAIGDFSAASTAPGQQNLASISGYTVTWYSSNPSVAAICNGVASDPAACTVSGNKLPAGTAVAVGVGTSAITAVAIASDNSGTTATAIFSVAGPSTQTVTTLAISPGAQTIALPLPNAAPLTSAQLPKFVAIGTYAATGLQVDLSSSPSLSWISSNPLIATVNSGGYVQAIGAGTATITAEYASGSSVATATATVTVVSGSASEPLQSVAILPATQSVPSPLQTSQLLAIGTFSTAPLTQDVTKGLASPAITIKWTSSNPAVATVGSPELPQGALFPQNVPGLVTAVSQGTVAIIAVASNPDNTLVTSTAAFTVAGGSSEEITALQIVPGTQAATAAAQQSKFFVLGTNGSTGLQYDETSSTSLVWTSSNKAVATICTVTDPTSCTAPNSVPGLATAVGAGSTTITATWTNIDHSKVVATATYTVTIGAAQEQLNSINIIPSTITVGQIQDTGQFLAFGSFSTTPTIRDITDAVSWISTTPQIVTIESTGPLGVPGAQAGLATAIGEGPSIVVAEDSTHNTDGTVVTATATFSCPIGQCSAAVSGTLSNVTVYNVGENTGTTGTWLVIAPTNTAPNSLLPADQLIHCGPGALTDPDYGTSVCVATYPIGTPTVTLTVVTPKDSTFGGWGAECETGTGNNSANPYQCTIALEPTNPASVFVYNQTVGVIFNK